MPLPVDIKMLDLALLAAFLAMSGLLSLINIKLYSRKLEKIRAENQVYETNPFIRKVIQLTGPQPGFILLYVALVVLAGVFYLVAPAFIKAVFLLVLIGGVGFGLFNDGSTLREMLHISKRKSQKQ